LRVSRWEARASEQVGVVEQALIVVEGRVAPGDRRDRIEMRKVDGSSNLQRALQIAVARACAEQQYQCS
jgi:hypothetical protein